MTFSSSIRRSGVLPYTVIKGKIYFILGSYFRNFEYTDFGGGVQKNEGVIEAASREFREETRECFHNVFYSKKLLGNCPRIVVGDMCMIFLYVPPKSVLKVPLHFELKGRFSHYSARKYQEITHIVFVKEDAIKKMIATRKGRLWSRIREFIRVCLQNDPSLFSTLTLRRKSDLRTQKSTPHRLAVSKHQRSPLTSRNGIH